MSIEILPKPEPSTATGHVTDRDLERIAGKRLPIMRQAFNRDAASGARKRSALWRAVKQMKAASFDDLLEALSNGDLMADLYERPDKERAIDVSAVEVSVTRVTYSVRYSHKTRRVGLKRLREIYQETKT